MPFKSNAQRKFLFLKHPKVAKEFAKATPKGKKLPEHVKGKKPKYPGQLLMKAKKGK
jgi:hypothetical protein